MMRKLKPDKMKPLITGNVTGVREERGTFIGGDNIPKNIKSLEFGKCFWIMLF